MELFATTGDAFVRVGAHTRLQGSGAQCLALDGDTVYVGCRGGGLKRSADGGDSFEDVPLPEPDVFSVAVSAADGAVYVGTEPSRLFRSRDGGESWEELVALQEIPSRPDWSYPPRPWTSHVRWIAPSPHDREVVLVGIELGGLMRTEDGGASFSDHRPEAARDVHCLAWHPSAAGARLRGRRRRRRLEPRRRPQLGPGGRRARPPLRLGAGRRPGRSGALVRLGGPGPVRGTWAPPVRLGDLPLGALGPLAGDRGPARLPRLRARDRRRTALRRSGRRHTAPERRRRRELDRAG